MNMPWTFWDDSTTILGSSLGHTIGGAGSSDEGEEDDDDGGRRHDADDDGEGLPGSIWRRKQIQHVDVKIRFIALTPCMCSVWWSYTTSIVQM